MPRADSHQKLTISGHLFQHVDVLTYLVLIIIYKLLIINTVIILVLKVRRRRHREVEWLV